MLSARCCARLTSSKGVGKDGQITHHPLHPVLPLVPEEPDPIRPWKRYVVLEVPVHVPCRGVALRCELVGHRCAPPMSVATPNGPAGGRSKAAAGTATPRAPRHSCPAWVSHGAMRTAPNKNSRHQTHGTTRRLGFSWCCALFRPPAPQSGKTAAAARQTLSCSPSWPRPWQQQPKTAKRSCFPSAERCDPWCTHAPRVCPCPCRRPCARVSACGLSCVSIPACGVRGCERANPCTRDNPQVRHP